MSGAWRKLKKSVSSRFSFHFSSSASNSSSIDATPASRNIQSSSSTATFPPPLPPSPSKSNSFRFRLSRTLSVQSSTNTCAICLGCLRKGQGQAIFIAECSHSFHFGCIADNVKHGNHVCPVCRTKWQDLPCRAPTAVNDCQVPTTVNGPPQRAIGLARVSPNLRRVEPEHFSDDEALLVAPPTSVLASQQTVTIKSYLEYPAIAASDSSSKFGVLLRICAPPLDNVHQFRAPIDLVTVIDVSGSMVAKLGLVKRALNFIIQHLGPSDRLSIVTFSSTAQRILPLRKMSDDGREDALNAVNSISSGGGTSIVAGLKKGVRVLEERRECNPVVEIILLSDGRDNHSVEANQDSSESNKLKYLEHLPSSIFPNANREPSQSSIPVHAFGFGADHDSIAMHAISDASGGTFSFIESIDILQDAFARCIGGLLSIVVQDAKVNIGSISSGVQIESLPSGRYKSEISDEGHQAVIEIGNLYAGEEKEFLVYLSVPKENSETTPLMYISCFYKDLASVGMGEVQGERVEIRRPQILCDSDKILSLEFDRQRNRLSVIEAIGEAQRMAERGDLGGAQSLLEERRSVLLSSASAQAGDSLCNWLEAELREIRARMGSMEMYHTSGRAYILSGMSSHAWQRATTRGHSITLRRDGNSNTTATTSYETPSMTSMLSKSQILTISGGLVG